MKKKIAIVAGSTATKSLLDLLGSMILARALLPEGVGQTILISSFAIMMVAFSTLGIGQANILLRNANRIDTSKIVANTSFISLIGGGVLFALSLLLITHNSSYFGELSTGCVSIVSLGLASSYASSLLLPILVSQLKASKVSSADLLLSIVTVGGYSIIYFVYPNSFDVETALYLQAIGKITNLLLVLFYLKGDIKRWHAFDIDLLFNSLKVGRGFYFVFLAVQANLYASAFILQYFDRNLSNVGLYYRAVSTTAIIATIPLAIGPYLFARWSRSAPDAVLKELNMALILTLSGMCFVLPLLLYFSSQIMIVLYGDSFEKSGEIFKVVIFGVALKICSEPLVNYFASIQQPFRNTSAYIVGSLITLILGFFVIERYGVDGAAWTFVISNFSVFIFLFVSKFAVRQNKLM